MNCIILDVAHGKDTPGKRSPDGFHEEWKWSRERVKKIVSNLRKQSMQHLDFFAPYMDYDLEPGLTERVKKYNDISSNYDLSLMLSIHNNAYTNNWSAPYGIELYTSRGETLADKYATDLYKHLKSRCPNERFRAAYWLDKGEFENDPDKEANFMVISGNKYVKPLYHGILLEWLFMTNKQDVDKLTSPKHNEYFEDIITTWIINLNEYLSWEE